MFYQEWIKEIGIDREFKNQVTGGKKYSMIQFLKIVKLLSWFLVCVQEIDLSLLSVNQLQKYVHLKKESVTE